MSSVLGMYFEDFEIGKTFRTTGRTITETDIVNFAGFSGDYTSIHVDANYAKKTPFGERIAHGMCVLSIATGLMVRLNIFEGTVVAFYGIDKWRFIAPVKIGTTIYVESKVVDKIKKKEGVGIVVFETTVLDENNRKLMQGVMRVAIASRDKGG